MEQKIIALVADKLGKKAEEVKQQPQEQKQAKEQKQDKNQKKEQKKSFHTYTFLLQMLKIRKFTAQKTLFIYNCN